MSRSERPGSSTRLVSPSWSVASWRSESGPSSYCVRVPWLASNEGGHGGTSRDVQVASRQRSSSDCWLRTSRWWGGGVQSGSCCFWSVSMLAVSPRGWKKAMKRRMRPTSTPLDSLNAWSFGVLFGLPGTLPCSRSATKDD